MPQFSRSWFGTQPINKDQLQASSLPGYATVHLRPRMYWMSEVNSAINERCQA